MDKEILMKAVIPDGTHLANSKKSLGDFAANLLTNCKNQVAGTPILKEVNWFERRGTLGWALGAVGLVLGAGGATYGWWQKRNAQKLIKAQAAALEAAEAEKKSEISEELHAEEEENFSVNPSVEMQSPSISAPRFIVSLQIYNSLKAKFLSNAAENYFIYTILSNCSISEDPNLKIPARILLENGVPYACLSNSGLQTELNKLCSQTPIEELLKFPKRPLPSLESHIYFVQSSHANEII